VTAVLPQFTVACLIWWWRRAGHRDSLTKSAYQCVNAGRYPVTTQESERTTVADSQPLQERTLVVLKPDAVARGLAGRIIQRFEDASLKIIGVKMREMDAEFTRKHYFDLEERLGAAVYNATAEFMQHGPVIALVVEGEDAVATVRKIVGSTYPNEAPPGSIRGDFAHQSKAVAVATGKAVANLVHASGKRDEAEYEVDLWFDKNELFSYRSLAEAFGW
jgi:nucleoside-diphosphate kinase